MKEDKRSCPLTERDHHEDPRVDDVSGVYEPVFLRAGRLGRGGRD